MDQVTNVLIVGVGGQGTILASRVLSGAVLAAGHQVKVSEVHGMSQRGGSVVTQVRFGQAVDSPLIAPGDADYILAFEKLEALRWLPYLKKGGMIIVNDQRIDPMPVISGKADYPEDIFPRLREQAGRTAVVNAIALARKCGTDKAVNMVLMGVLSTVLAIDPDIWQQVIRETVPAKFLTVNEAAFQAGRETAAR